MTPENIDLHRQECIRLCWECRDICQDTLFNHILERGDEHPDTAHIRLMIDCIQICQVAADFMRRDSYYHTFTCRSCAAVCMACAEYCERMAKEQPALKKCAEICRRCGDSCTMMSGIKQAA